MNRSIQIEMSSHSKNRRGLVRKDYTDKRATEAGTILISVSSIKGNFTEQSRRSLESIKEVGLNRLEAEDTTWMSFFTQKAKVTLDPEKYIIESPGGKVSVKLNQTVKDYLNKYKAKNKIQCKITVKEVNTDLQGASQSRTRPLANSVGGSKSKRQRTSTEPIPIPPLLSIQNAFRGQIKIGRGGRAFPIIPIPDTDSEDATVLIPGRNSRQNQPGNRSARTTNDELLDDMDADSQDSQLFLNEHRLGSFTKTAEKQKARQRFLDRIRDSEIVIVRTELENLFQRKSKIWDTFRIQAPSSANFLMTIFTPKMFGDSA